MHGSAAFVSIYVYIHSPLCRFTSPTKKMDKIKQQLASYLISCQLNFNELNSFHIS